MGFGLFDPAQADEPVAMSSSFEDPALKAIPDSLDDYLFSSNQQNDDTKTSTGKNRPRVLSTGSHASADMSPAISRRREGEAVTKVGGEDFDVHREMPPRSMTTSDLTTMVKGKKIGTVRTRTRVSSGHSKGDFSSLPPEPP